MSPFRSLCFLLAWLSITFVPASGYSQEEDRLTTSLELLETFLDSCLTALETEGLFGSGDSVRIEVMSVDSTFSGFQYLWLADRLRSKYNAVVLSKSSPGGGHSLKVLLRWVDWKINYVPFRNKFWRKGRYQRNLAADFYVEVEDQNAGNTNHSQRFEYAYQDSLKGDQIGRVENKEFAFTVGLIERSRSNLSRWLEPAFLFAITGAVVYIFYAIRSD